MLYESKLKVTKRNRKKAIQIHESHTEKEGGWLLTTLPVQENLLQVEGLNDTEICKGFIQKCMQGIRLYSYENRILQRQHPLKWPNY